MCIHIYIINFSSTTVRGIHREILRSDIESHRIFADRKLIRTTIATLSVYFTEVSEV